MYIFFLKIDVEMFDFVIEYARCTYKNGASCFQVKSLFIKKRMYIVPVLYPVPSYWKCQIKATLGGSKDSIDETEMHSTVVHY